MIPFFATWNDLLGALFGTLIVFLFFSQKIMKGLASGAVTG